MVTSFLQVIIWPLVVLLIAFYLRKPIKKFIGEVNEINLKAGPAEILAKSKKEEIAASLGAATTQVQDSDPDVKQPPTTESTRDIVKLVNQTVTPQTIQNLAGVSILWVDDKPSNNTFIRHALETLGIRFTICISTDDAIKELKSSSFDAIISDMSRPPDFHAGFTLLEKLKQMKINIPFIIYARGGNKPQFKEEALNKGAYDSASGPQGLYKTIVNLFDKSNKSN